MGVESEISSLASARGIVAIDVSSVDQTLAPPCRGIMVGVTGNVAVQMADGTSGVLPALAPGSIYAVCARKILHTGTTATGIIALI